MDASAALQRPLVTEVQPGAFEASRHYYPRVLNARLHPLVRYFLGLGNHRLAERYCHLHPRVRLQAVRDALARRTRHLRWAGADLFHVTTDAGSRRNVVIEVNSSPSGQKSMPPRDPDDERGGYAALLERTFLPMIGRRGPQAGRLAVLWDKNEIETSGYASVLAELTGEPVLLARCPATGPSPLRWSEGALSLETGQGAEPVRAAFRYVTQRPWTRIPPLTKTPILNPVLACLAGGRNKLLAAKGYDLHNARLRADGLAIRVPETVRDVGLGEVPIWVERMGGVAVVKDPYSNAGQGVYTITSAEELEAFMDAEHRYDRFIVQALIGNSQWSSRTTAGRFYHVGTVPDRRGDIYVADLRFMLGNGPDGFYPIALYARRARSPLAASLEGGASSWSMLGTNLSVRTGEGEFSTEPERLLLMDERDFNSLGLGLDDLCEAYIQSVLAATAIDETAQELVTRKGVWRRKLFRAMVPDPALHDEIL